jgi:uncharacterized membrane protein
MGGAGTFVTPPAALTPAAPKRIIAAEASDANVNRYALVIATSLNVSRSSRYRKPVTEESRADAGWITLPNGSCAPCNLGQPRIIQASVNGLKLLGHPLHPAVVHFPVAAWPATVVTDILFVALRDALWWSISLWLLVAGTVAALGAMTAGFTDLLALPTGGPAQRCALRHMYFMSAAWTIYAIDLLVRALGGSGARGGSGAAGAAVATGAPGVPTVLLGWLCLALSVLGFAGLVAGTHVGAQLVYDLGVGQTGKKLP